MATRYQVSRTFLYEQRNHLAAQMEGLFGVAGPKVVTTQHLKEQELRLMLKLRLEGRCSLSAISSMLEELNMPYCSTGYISQHLRQTGEQLPNIVEWQGSVVFASDEIFYLGRRPILITVEVCSGAILQMEMLPSLTKEAWEMHWKRLREKGILPLKSISDEGWVMAAAREQLQEPWQPDTFHAVSYRLGEFARRLERQVEKAFEYACQRQSRSQNAKSPKVRQSTEQQAQQAQQAFEQAYAQLQDFRFLYHCILKQNDAFLPQLGAVRNRCEAEAEVSLAIECLRSLNIAGLDKALDEVQNILPQLYQFLDSAAQATAELQAQLGEHLLPFFTHAWLCEQKARKVKNNASYRKRKLAEAQLALNLLQEHYQMSTEDFQAFTCTIFQQLDIACAQSSAMVETVNSFVRPFLDDSRDQPSQALLNLIMFYWNHRTFLRGKRKGKAPMEILSGSHLNKNWLDLLLEQVQA